MGIKSHSRWRPRREIPLANGNSSQGLVGVENDSPIDVFLGELVDALSHNTVRVLAILVNHDMAGRFFREDLATTFEIRAVSSLGKFDNNHNRHTHTGEGNHLDDNGRIACLLEVSLFELLYELEQSGFSLASDEDDLATSGSMSWKAVELITIERSRSSGERTVLSCDWS